MTLEGHSNHYNVKFLKGYGHSISVKDSKTIIRKIFKIQARFKIEKQKFSILQDMNLDFSKK